MTIEKVSKGAPIVPAMKTETWNSFVDAAIYAKSRRGKEDGRKEDRRGTLATTVLVRNDSGADVGHLYVLGIADVAVSPDDSETTFRYSSWLSGVEPTTAHEGKFVIVSEPIPDGGYGKGRISGISAVQINVTSSTHQRADVDPGHTERLASSEDGSAQILWREGGTGLQWAIVRICCPDLSAESDDSMWCGWMCDYVEDCCVFLGTAKRLEPSGDYCDPSKTEHLCWIAIDPVYDEFGEVVPQWQLIDETGWIRKIADSFVCEYPMMFEAQELATIELDLPIYEWCFPATRRLCPLETETITARWFSVQLYDPAGGVPPGWEDAICAAPSPTCQTIDDIGEIELTWQDVIESESQVNCSPAGAFANGAFSAYFNVETTQPIRLFPIDFVYKAGEPEEIDDAFGHMWLDWCDGSLVKVFMGDYYGNDPWDNEVALGDVSGITYTGGCTTWLDYALEDRFESQAGQELVTQAGEPLAGQGAELGPNRREAVTYRYRILAACEDSDEGLTDWNVCLQHVHPECHSLVDEPLQDAVEPVEATAPCAKIRGFKFVTSEFGTITVGNPAIGYFGGGTGPSQFGIHKFAGCYNELRSPDCIFCNTGHYNSQYVMVLTW